MGELSRPRAPAGPGTRPRPSDYDPQPPMKVQERQLREQDVVADEDENEPIELDENTQRLAGLVREEERRRRERLGIDGADRPVET